MSGVQKHCSILNYLKHADSDLYELIQDLCLGRMFAPRKGSQGVTFLHPSKDLLSEIKSKAYGDNPEEAVKQLQSLIIADHMAEINDFTDSDIPTFLGNKLPVADVKGDKVLLSNGAEITVDSGFKARGDRDKMAVYHLSKALVPTDTEKSSAKPSADKKASAAKKKVKGGADYAKTRAALFEQVLADYCDCGPNGDRDPALEVLVSLMEFLNKNGSSAVADVVATQLSNDTIASLAIVLQPYRTNKNESLKYIPDTVFEQWVSKSSNSLHKHFSYIPNPVQLYRKYQANAAANGASVLQLIRSVQGSLAEEIARPTAIKAIAAAHKQVANGFNNQRKFVLLDPVLAMAEAELRVYSALTHDNCNGSYNKDEFVKMFEVHTLDKVYICSLDSAKLIQDSNIGYYMSTIGLLARSDAFVYHPGQALEGELKNIVNETLMISLDKCMMDPALDSKRDEAYNKVFANLVSAIGDYMK